MRRDFNHVEYEVVACGFYSLTMKCPFAVLYRKRLLLPSSLPLSHLTSFIFFFCFFSFFLSSWFQSFILLQHPSEFRKARMGNCQAIDAVALVIQHPDGRIERLYWSVTASEVMRMNPGHYVSLIIPLPTDVGEGDNDDKNGEDRDKVRFTRVKLLRPSETLTLGHAYRLITSQGIPRCSLVQHMYKL